MGDEAEEANAKVFDKVRRDTGRKGIEEEQFHH